MKKYIYIIILFCGVLVTSCQPNLDLENPNALTTSTYYKTADELVDGVNGAYNIMQRTGGWGLDMPYVLNGKGDDYTYTFKASAGFRDVTALCNYTVTADNQFSSMVYTAMYVQEYACNLILEKIDQATMVNNDTLKNRLRGEAYFLRGLAHFYLTTSFGEEIPYRDHTPSTTDNFYASPLPKGQMYQKIVDDFVRAKKLLPVRSVIYKDQSNIGRATQGSARAFLAKTYLMKPILQQGSLADWTNASAELDTIIRSNEYSLTQNFRDNHTETNENNQESVFEVQFYNNLNGSFNNSVNEDFIYSWGQSDQSTWRQVNIGMMDASNTNSTWWNMSPTPRAMNEFERANNSDPTSSIIDPRYSMSIWGPGGAKFDSRSDAASKWVAYEKIVLPSSPNYGIYLGTRKYCADKASADPGWGSGINDRLIRYSDVLLMYAECLVEIGRPNDALPYIDQVRSRANNQLALTTSADNFLFYANAPGTLPSVENLIAAAPTINGVQINTLRRAIKHERFVELFSEGWHYFDLLRWYYNPNDPDASIALDPIINKFKAQGLPYSFDLTRDEYMPIPSLELQMNKNMHGNSAN